jgi:hypothetical protein
MVTEIPSYDEILGWSEESFSSDEFTEIDEKMPMDEQLMLITLFVVLAKLYTDFEYKSFDYVLEHFPEAAAKAEKKISETSKTELTKIVEEHRTTILTEYKIHEKVISKVKLDYNLKETFNTLNLSVKATLNQLKDDVKVKAAAFKAGMGVPDEFNLKANFKRAMRKTKNFVNFNVQFVKQKITRAAQKMRYGKNMLYYWVVAGRRTCEKCYGKARLPPRRIDEWEYDHPNGHCELVPEKDNATQVYLDYLKESEKYTDLTLI